MYLAYGIAPYSANGKDVVANYPIGHGSTPLQKVNNGTSGHAPKPGDIISFNTWDYNSGLLTTFGHTAIVVSASIDCNGNGTIITLNQNLTLLPGATTAQQQGYLNETIRNWSVVQDNYGNGKPARQALGWLTPQGNISPSIPSQIALNNGAVVNSRTVTLQWKDTGDPDNGPQNYRTFAVTIRSADNSWHLTSPLSTNTTSSFDVPVDGVYYWHVQSNDGAAFSSPSAEWSFVVTTSSCSLKTKGDTDCNGTVTLADFELWREEFIAQQQGARTTSRADFNGDGSVDLLDFELWREGYLQNNPLSAAVKPTDSTSTTPIGETTAVFFNQTEYTIATSGTVDLDVYMENNPATQASSTDFTLQYSPNLLAYDSSSSSYSSPECLNTNQNLGYLNQSPNITDDPTNGLLRITRAAVVDGSTLPYGRFCAGTFRFISNSGDPIPSTAVIQLLSSTAPSGAAGPQAALTPAFDNARQSTVITIGALPTSPGQPGNLQVGGTTNSSITLNWDDTSANEDGFRVYKWDSTSGGWLLLNWVGPHITQFIDGQLNCGTTFRYQIRAFNNQGESDPSTESDGMTAACYSTFIPLISY